MLVNVINRARRVKCDETKPNCLRCANFGRKCAGYASKEDTPPKELLPPIKRRLLSKSLHTETRSESPESFPQPSATFTPVPSKEPQKNYMSTLPPTIKIQNETELRYLYHFRDVTAFELAGGFPPKLWHWIVMRAYEDLAIRQLTIATAAMHMAIKPLLSGQWDPVSEIHRQYALQQYGEALTVLQETLAGHGDATKLAAVSALLIFCFESLQGDVSPALIHMQKALELCIKKVITYPVKFEYPCTPAIENQFESPACYDLLIAFARIDRPSLSLLCREKGCPPRPAGWLCKLMSPPDGYTAPSTFSTIEDARRHLDDIRWRLLPGTNAPESLSTLLLSQEAEIFDSGTISWQVKQWYQSMSENTTEESESSAYRLGLWHDAFFPLLNFAMTPAGQSMFLIASILHIQALAAELVLSGFFPPSFSTDRSCSFSDFYTPAVPEFESIERSTSGALIVPTNLPSHRRNSSQSSSSRPQDDVALFPTVQAILKFSRQLVAHPGFSKGFVFDNGIISSIQIVVMLCPDRSLKKKAVGVMNSMIPRREGVWDSRVCAEAGKKFIGREDNDAGIEMIDPLLRDIL